MGANLASVHSLQEYQAIQGLLMSATRAYTIAWLGGSDAQEVIMGKYGTNFSLLNTFQTFLKISSHIFFCLNKSYDLKMRKLLLK